MASGFSGGCLCGAVRYESAAEPVVCGHCHCVDCRKSSGTGHCSHIGVPKEAVTVTGALSIYERPADSGNIVGRAFCPTCGAAVYSLNSGMPEMIFPRASSLDDPEVFKPQMIVYTNRAPSWDHMDASLPAFATQPEGGPDAVVQSWRNRSDRARLSRAAVRCRISRISRRTRVRRFPSPINREQESTVDKSDVDWHGPMPSVITPYDAEGRIDEDAFLENIELCIGYGMTGLLVAGNSGDFWSLSMDERKRLMALGVEGARGRVPVIGCTGAFLAPDVIDLARTAAQIGCAGVMVLPPFFYSPNTEDIYAHYKAVSDAAELPLMLYNFPANSVPTMTFELVERLAELKAVVAIKETSGNFDTFYKILTLVGERIHVFCGQMVCFGVPAIVMGSPGYIDTNPNLWGAESVELYEAAVTGDLVRGRALQKKALALHELVSAGDKNTYSWVKTGMTLVGLPGGVARLPQRPLGEEQRAELRRGLERLGIAGLG